jgi:hypothetical protein
MCGRTQIAPFGCGTGARSDVQLAFHIGGSARVLPDTRLSPSVTLTIGMAGESAWVQRRLDWSA